MNAKEAEALWKAFDSVRVAYGLLESIRPAGGFQAAAPAEPVRQDGPTSEESLATVVTLGSLQKAVLDWRWRDAAAIANALELVLLNLANRTEFAKVMAHANRVKPAP